MNNTEKPNVIEGMIFMIDVKLTRIESNHQRLRTNEVEGVAPFIPQVGTQFIIFGKSLTDGLDMRIVNTSEIQNVEFHSEDRKFTVKTLNSVYEIEILNKNLSQSEIFSYIPTGGLPC